MGKIVILNNDVLSNMCFKVAERFYGRTCCSNLCLNYVKDCRGGYNNLAVRIGYVDDYRLNCILAGNRITELDDYLDTDANIYLLNESDLDIDEVVERISKYFNKSDIVTFNDEDFAKFKEQCKFLAEKMGFGKLNNLDDYVDYLSDLDLDDCYAQKEDGEDDYDTQLIYCLLEPFCNMLKEKGVEYK